MTKTTSPLDVVVVVVRKRQILILLNWDVAPKRQPALKPVRRLHWQYTSL